MMKLNKAITLVILTAIVFFAGGCIDVAKMTYKITIENGMKGHATVHYYDITSDAIGNKEFEEDKKLLFNLMYESQEFVDTMKVDGVSITSRKLFVENGKLNGEITFDFEDISALEPIRYESGIWFLTVMPEDSITAPDGQMVTGTGYKRVLWDGNKTEFEFSRYSPQEEVQKRSFVSEFKKRYPAK